MLLRLTDGTTTLTLSGSGAYLGATYFPANQAGAERISESFPIILEGTESAVRAAAQAVDTLLRSAADRRGNLRPPVYIEFRPIDSGEIRRAEILSGFTSWSQVPAERMLSGTLNTVRVVVTIERTGGWQGAEAEIPLASSSQTERTGGVAVYNNDNAGNANWAAAAGANILGTRPAPIRLRITNASGSGLQWETFHVGVNAFSAPGSADLWLLGSEAVSGAAASWSAGVTHNSLQWIFPLSSTLLGQTQGRTFRVLAAFTVLSSTANLRAAVGTYISPAFVATRVGGERTGVRELVDLGEFPIPPGGYSAGNAAAALAITVRSAAAGSGTLDFVMLMPTDSYRRLEQAGFVAANGEAVEDDGVDGGAYLVSGSNRYTIVKAVGGGPLVVHPGRDNRIYILFDEGANFVAGRQMTVQAWYRPVYDNV